MTKNKLSWQQSRFLKQLLSNTIKEKLSQQSPFFLSVYKIIPMIMLLKLICNNVVKKESGVRRQETGGTGNENVGWVERSKTQHNPSIVGLILTDKLALASLNPTYT